MKKVLVMLMAGLLVASSFGIADAKEGHHATHSSAGVPQPLASWGFTKVGPNQYAPLPGSGWAHFMNNALSFGLAIPALMGAGTNITHASHHQSPIVNSSGCKSTALCR